MTLRAATLLGENAIEVLDDVVAHLRASGVDIVVDKKPHVDRIDLLFACGLLTMEMIAAGGDLEVVAAPVFPGETAPEYRSVVIARQEVDQAAGCIAVNEYGSWSGWHGYRIHRSGSVTPRHLMTGSHAASIDCVLRGDADFAAIDSSVWSFLIERKPSLRDLSVVDITADWPAPPFSVRASLDRGRKADLVRELCAAPNVVVAGPDEYRFMLAAIH